MTADTLPHMLPQRDSARPLAASIIVPARDAAATIDDCLRALRAQRGVHGGFEIIVVDDGSRDATGDFARRHAPGVRVIQQTHQGAAAARNRGAAAAEGRVLLFTDADCRPHPGWAAAMLRPFADRRVAGVKGRFASDQAATVARFAQAEYEEKEARMLARASVAFADTAAAGYRADVFRAVGGFRGDMRAVEDTELAFRVVAAGHRLVMAPDARVLHRHPETVGAYARRKFRYGLWGARAYLGHPARVADDSRTPVAMKLQLVLAPVLCAVLPLAAGGVTPVAAAATAAAAFGATTAPFLWRARRHGAAVVAIAPAMLLVRALAVGAGLACGIAWRVAAGGLPPARPSPKPGAAAPALPARSGEPARRGEP